MEILHQLLNNQPLSETSGNIFGAIVNFPPKKSIFISLIMLKLLRFLMAIELQLSKQGPSIFLAAS